MALILILFIICLFNYTDISRVSPSNLTLREGSHGQFTCLSKYPPDWYYSESEILPRNAMVDRSGTL